MRKNLDPNLKPEKQTCHAHKWKYGKAVHRSRKSWIWKKRPEPINQSINKTSKLSQKIPGRTEIEMRKTNNVHSKDLTHSINNTNCKMSNRDPLIPDVPFHPGPVHKPLPELIKQNVSYPQSSLSSTNIDNINSSFDFEENSPFQEGVMSEHFKDKSFFQEPKRIE